MTSSTQEPPISTDLVGYYCPQCDYDVRGLVSNVCPECGHTFTVSEADSGLTAFWLRRSRVRRAFYWPRMHLKFLIVSLAVGVVLVKLLFVTRNTAQ